MFCGLLMILYWASLNLPVKVLQLYQKKSTFNDPLLGLSKSSSESITIIPEKVHKTYYKMILKKYTTKVQKKD